jgi:hypothetical protein
MAPLDTRPETAAAIAKAKAKAEIKATAPKAPVFREDPPIKGPEALVALSAYNLTFVKRYQEVADLFNKQPHGKEINPTTHNDFRVNLQAVLSLINMNYVMTGEFDRSLHVWREQAKGEKMDAQEDKRVAAGLAISKEQSDQLAAGGLDPALLNSPAAQLAIASGADLLEDEDVDDSGLPKPEP